MPKTVLNIILLLNIYVCLTEAVALKSQVSQQQLNSLEETKISSRTKSSAKEQTSVKYDQVGGWNNPVLDNFDHRYPDGSYEFRYELADGQARYERGYFIKLNNHKSLVVVGYYSYRMPDGQYVTVFYNADQYGYRQNQGNSVPSLSFTARGNFFCIVKIIPLTIRFSFFKP